MWEAEPARRAGAAAVARGRRHWQANIPQGE
jgi:hypothetical protein